MDSALLETIAETVRELHSDNLKRLEALLEDCTTSPQSVKSLSFELPQPYQREALSRLATCWSRYFPEVGPQAVSAALQALRYAADRQTRAEICWSGPVSSLQGFRTTAEAFRELISRATKTILIVSYAVSEVEFLRESLDAALNRGVQVRLVLEDFNVFTQESWRSKFHAFGEKTLQRSEIYVWPISERRLNEGRVYGSMHVKCLVVDGEAILMTSANWSGAAMQDNMELGLVVTDAEMAKSVSSHFEDLIKSNILVLLK